MSDLNQVDEESYNGQFEVAGPFKIFVAEVDGGTWCFLRFWTDPKDYEEVSNVLEYVQQRYFDSPEAVAPCGIALDIREFTPYPDIIVDLVNRLVNREIQFCLTSYASKRGYPKSEEHASVAAVCLGLSEREKIRQN